MTLKFETYYRLTSKSIKNFRHGKDHRLNGPSSIWQDGCQFWYQYGKKHRSDGPAEIYNGIHYYYVNGLEYTKEEYYNDPEIRTLL